MGAHGCPGINLLGDLFEFIPQWPDGVWSGVMWEWGEVSCIILPRWTRWGTPRVHPGGTLCASVAILAQVTLAKVLVAKPQPRQNSQD